MSATGCPCDQPRDPRVVDNAPGLSTLAYRVDDFSGFRRALLRPGPAESALLGWHPAAGDLGLQILEWWAYLADILTFYNERIANEAYLRTAQLPASVTGLVGLLGYEPRPAIGAVGRVAAIRTASRPNEPVGIPVGLRLASTATPGVPVETFEAAAAAFSGPSDARIALQSPPALLEPAGAGDEGIGSVLLRGTVSGAAVGDVLLALARDPTEAELAWTKATVVSTAAEPDPTGGSNTRVALSAAEAYDAWWMADASAAGSRLVRWTGTAALWSQTSDAAVSLEGNGLRVRLSAVVRGISPGDPVFFDGGDEGIAVARVTATSEEFLGVAYPGSSGSPPSPPDIPVLHTVLDVEHPYAAWVGWAIALTEGVTVRFGFADVGTPVPTPATTLAALPAAVRPATALTVPPGGTAAFVEDATGAGIPVTATAAGDGTITLAASPATPATFSLAAPLRLLVHLVDVSRGATVAGETLGAGDASVAGQTFALAKSPLTYLASGAAWTSTLRVAVDGILWTEVPTFYDQPPDARVYVVSQGSDGKSRVRFGDGTSGARLPTGSRVVATYRHGAGAASPPAGRLTTILEPQANLASIRNPVAVWGGADAERPTDVRTNAPASVLAFGRAISADDYETVAGRAPGVTRARAYWSWDAVHQRSLVKVYAGDDAAAAAAARSALVGAEDPNRPVTVAQATPIALTVACTLVVAADRTASEVVAAAKAALSDPGSGLFAPQTMRIGRPLYSSELEAALLVPGVEAVHALSVRAGGGEVFSTDPVARADPGEGSFFLLAATTITPLQADG